MKDLNSIKGLKIAHRGLHDKKTPENSLAAFKKALAKNLPIELDIHLLKDKKIVVFHDDNLKRMTGINKKIKECTYDEIKKLKLLNTNEKIPLLKDVLKLVDGKVLLDIEFKCTNRAGILEREACNLLDNYKGKFLVKSFNPLSVLWFRINKKDYIRGQLAGNLSNMKMNSINRYILKKMLLNIITKPDFIAYELSINQKILNKIKKKGIPLLLWTIKNEEEMKYAKSYGDTYIYEVKDEQ